jgi:site-specific recombinase XerD
MPALQAGRRGFEPRLPLQPHLDDLLRPKSVVVQLARFRLDYRARGFSEATIRHTESAVRSFADSCGGISDVSLIEGDDLRRFIIVLKERPPRHNGWRSAKLSPTSVNTYTRAVRGFWSWLEQTRAISHNPLARVPAPRYPRKVARVYTEEQMRALFRHVAGMPRESALVHLFLDSGIRLAELAGLKVEDVDIAQCSVRVLGKGGKERFSYFSAETALCIRDYVASRRAQPEAGDFLFTAASGSPLSSDGIQTALERLGRASGLMVRLAPHTLRHTYATLCLRNGNNLEYVRITLGHTNIKTTSDAYLAASQADIGRAHRRFSPVANLRRNRSSSSGCIDRAGVVYDRRRRARTAKLCL